MAYDFTADSGIQTTLSGELTTQASEFETQVSQLYSEIDGLASSWKGEDYTAFQQGTDGYKTALADLKEGIDLFAKHFERLSAGTEELAVSLATIIENATNGGTAGGSAAPGQVPGADQATQRGQTKSDGSYNPYGGGRPERIDNGDGTYSYVYRDQNDNIRQIDTWDTNGNLIGQETYDQDGQTINYSMKRNQDDGSYVVQQYEAGNVISYEEYDSNDNLVKTIEYKYDEDGNNILRTTKNSDGTYFEEDISNDDVVCVRQYDEDGNLLFENKSGDAAALAAALAGGARYYVNSNGSYRIVTEDSNGKVVTNYDSDGNKKFQRITDENENVTQTEWYDKDGNVIRRYEFDENGDVEHHYEADEDGKLIEVTDEDGSGNGAEDGSDDETDEGSEDGTGEDSEDGTEDDSDNETDDDSDDETDEGSENGTGDESDTGSGAGSDTDSGNGSDTDSGDGSDTDSGDGSSTGSGAGSDTDSGADSSTGSEGDSTKMTASPVTVSSGQRVTINGQDCYFLARSSSGTMYYTKGTEGDAQVFTFSENGTLEPYKNYSGEIISRSEFVSDRKVNMDYQWNVTYNNGTPYESIGQQVSNFTEGVKNPDYSYISYDPEYLKQEAVTLGNIDRGSINLGNSSLPEVIYLAPGQSIKYDKPWDTYDNVITGASSGTYLVYDSGRNAFFVTDASGSYKTISDGTFGAWITPDQLLSDRTTFIQ